MLKKTLIRMSIAVLSCQIVLVMGCRLRPHLVILDKKIAPKIYKDSTGSPDAGFEVRYRVQNTGSAGKIKLKVRLFTNEGGADQERTIFMAADEVQQITFDFDEFSWTANDAKAYEQIEIARH